MTYELFKASLLQELGCHFQPDTEISVQTLPRNNNITLDALTIMEPGHNITPTFYVQDYYEEYKNGAPMADVMQKLMEAYYQQCPSEAVDASFFCDFEYVKNRIVFKLVHYKKNKELLKEIPHIPYLDLAIVFYCLLSSSPQEAASILIRNSHLSLWDIDAAQLYGLAQANTPFLLASRFSELSQLIASGCAALAGGQDIDTPEESSPPMYVLTNEIRLYGASCILYKDLLADTAKRLKSDLYVLPSSIHEVIVLPASRDLSRDCLDTMVREVNATQLSDEEVLSDHVYYYSRKEKRLSR